MNKINRLIVPIILFSFILAACSNFYAEPTPVPEQEVVADFVPRISATGKVVPETWATLSVKSGGVVAEILVSEGDQVTAGSPLVILEGEAELQAALTATQLEETAAQIALDHLIENHDLALAQARESHKIAEDNLEDYLTAELREALALQGIADAEKAVSDAEKNLNRLKSTASQADIDDAKATVVLAADALDKARDNYEPYENKPEDNLTRATLLAKFSAAQHAYDSAVRRLNALQSTGNDLDIAVAEANLATVQAQLFEAERDWEDIQEGPDPVQVALLEAKVAEADRKVTDLLNGPDPDDLSLEQARLTNANAQVSAAQAAIEQLTLSAPFDGTVSEILVKQSEFISPGMPAIVLADLGSLILETTDLNEIDVAQVYVGSSATVTFDALPDLVLNTTVLHIAPKSTEGAGVNYTVRLLIDPLPDDLRWGMTAFIDIETE